MANFKKMKLSHQAIDSFMLKYVDRGSHPRAIPYTTSTHKKINFSPSEAINVGSEEYLFLLGQLSAVHKGMTDFPLNQMAVIRRKDGTDALWTRDTDLLRSFVAIGNQMGIILLDKRSIWSISSSK